MRPMPAATASRTNATFSGVFLSRLVPSPTRVSGVSPSLTAAMSVTVTGSCVTSGGADAGLGEPGQPLKQFEPAHPAAVSSGSGLQLVRGSAANGSTIGPPRARPPRRPRPAGEVVVRDLLRASGSPASTPRPAGPRAPSCPCGSVIGGARDGGTPVG